MPLRLQDGYEIVPYWKEVQEVGNRKLKEESLNWIVTLRPRTAADSEHTLDERTDDEMTEDEMTEVEMTEEVCIMEYNLAKKELSLAGIEPQELSATEFVDVHIIQTIWGILKEVEGEDDEENAE